MPSQDSTQLDSPAQPRLESYEQVLANIGAGMVAASDPFAVRVGMHVQHVLESHQSWAYNCAYEHQDSNLPCTEFEQAFMLGWAWVEAKMLGAGA